MAKVALSTCTSLRARRIPATLTPSRVMQAPSRRYPSGKSLPWAEATILAHAGPQSIASCCRVKRSFAFRLNILYWRGFLEKKYLTVNMK